MGMLISIYGSKELFVSEYRLMLAGKLLKKESYDTSREVATLELLKLRFGEAPMHQCEIMVRARRGRGGGACGCRRALVLANLSASCLGA